MSKPTSTALTALLRWREWDESRAEIALAQSSQKLESAKAGRETQHDTVTAIQQRRSRMLEGTLDPALLQVASEMEANAWRVLEACQADEALAEDRRNIAHQTLLDARARVRVVEARHSRVVAVERDRHEKVLFDRMSDLHAQSRRSRHD
jgi:hypothetical protein